MPAPVHAHPDGAVVAVRAVPGSSTAGVVGLYGEELLVALDAAETTRRLGPWIGHSGEFQR